MGAIDGCGELRSKMLSGRLNFVTNRRKMMCRDKPGPFACMTFGQALEQLKVGRRVARAGWNGRKLLGEGDAMYLYIYLSADGCSNFIVIQPVEGAIVPWTASQTDLLCEDWMVVQ